MHDTSGSQWRKWDLHVHTPYSLFHRYPGELEEAWELFLQDLENLPPEFKVIGVNDYISWTDTKDFETIRKKGASKI